MNNPIGIFDSGLGGLSVWEETKKLLPKEDIIYFADNKFCPYGEKKTEEVIDRSLKISKFLIEKGCKLIIVACNTATAAAIEVLRKKFDLPFVGMEPAIKPAANNTKTGKIGILATEGTFKGQLFNSTRAKYAKNVETITQPGYGLVELVELNQQNSMDAQYLLKKFIDPMIKDDIDHLVLGCTHYPFFIPSLNSILPESVTIVNPAPAIAKRVLQLLQENKLENEEERSASTLFFSSGNTQNIQQFIDSTFSQKVTVNNITL